MKRYKITRVYRISAETKAAALALVNGEQASEYLAYEAATEDQPRTSGWKHAVKQQLEAIGRAIAR